MTKNISCEATASIKTDLTSQITTHHMRSNKILPNLKILIQARPDLYINHGGDTVALECSTEALKKLGVEVCIDLLSKKNPKEYDIVHIYNFATPKPIEPFGRKALELGVPFVVTTLYEDRNIFYSKMHYYGYAIMTHINSNKNANWLLYENKINEIYSKEQKKEEINNQFLAENAAMLISSGEEESALLKRDYPYTKRIESCHFGSTRLPVADPLLFQKTYGISDYVLCVGRVELRKNQGMLMQALENEEVPVVLVAGKMTYNPDYEECVSKFTRKGRNLVVKNLSPEMLASAYAGARVHALPSWYELPGLVSLEAAINGANVVSSNYGTIGSYLGDLISYCSPDNSKSIKDAVMNAYETKPSSDLRDKAMSFTWEKSAQRLIELYQMVLSGNKNEIINKEALGKDDLKKESLNLFNHKLSSIDLLR